MDEIIARELRTLTVRVVFEPFRICLVDGRHFDISSRGVVTFLSGGIMIFDQDDTYAVVPYDKIVSLQTFFPVP